MDSYTIALVEACMRVDVLGLPVRAVSCHVEMVALRGGCGNEVLDSNLLLSRVKKRQRTVDLWESAMVAMALL